MTAYQQRTVGEILATTRMAITPRYQSAVDGLPTELRDLLGYHAGWWDADGQATQATGKAFAPSLALLCATTASLDTAHSSAAAVDVAAAVEMVHDASLLHDDIVDGDRFRRHRPATWCVYGTDQTLFAGVALAALAAEQLSGTGTVEICATVRQIYEGQIYDSLFERRRATVTIAEYLTMVEKKTAALLAVACALGARSAGAEKRPVAHYREFGRCLGIAYQIRDDLLGIWGDPEVTGKPVHSDLMACKKTAPVVAALASDTDAGRRLAALYRQQDPVTFEQAETMAALIHDAGGRNWAGREADRWKRQAEHELQQACPPDPVFKELRALCAAAVSRGQ